MKVETTIGVPDEIRDRLEAHKIHDSEPLWRVVDRMTPQTPDEQPNDTTEVES
jgi:hypothetical protein